MKRNCTELSRQYQATLRNYLQRGPQASVRAAQGLGRRAMALGLETLDLARIHEQALIALVLPSYSAATRDAMVRRAGTFFFEAVPPIQKTHRTAREANVHLRRVNRTLSQRSADLAASNRQLKQEIVQRKTVETALRKSERHYSDLL